MGRPAGAPRSLLVETFRLGGVRVACDLRLTREGGAPEKRIVSYLEEKKMEGTKRKRYSPANLNIRDLADSFLTTEVFYHTPCIDACELVGNHAPLHIAKHADDEYPK